MHKPSIILKLFEMLLILGTISGIIVAGGYTSSSDVFAVDVLTGEQCSFTQVPKLPKSIYNSSMVVHNGTILLCGGFSNEKKCLQFDHGTWKVHSTLNEERVDHSAVTTQTATFLFGGERSRTTYEYLPTGSTKWLLGKTEIPGGFYNGCAIAVKSEQEIWLIGGNGTGKRILSFNVIDHTFQELPFKLNVERIGHRCAFIPNTNKILISGGTYKYYNLQQIKNLNSTEIIDTKDGSVAMTSSPMNVHRANHGMGVVTINGQDRLAVFGGRYHDKGDELDCIELYNIKTEKWENAEIKLNEPKELFGFLPIKLSDVISKL